MFWASATTSNASPGRSIAGSGGRNGARVFRGLPSRGRTLAAPAAAARQPTGARGPTVHRGGDAGVADLRRNPAPLRYRERPACAPRRTGRLAYRLEGRQPGRHRGLDPGAGRAGRVPAAASPAARPGAPSAGRRAGARRVDRRPPCEYPPGGRPARPARPGERDGLGDGHGYLRAALPEEDDALQALVGRVVPFPGGPGGRGSRHSRHLPPGPTRDGSRRRIANPAPGRTGARPGARPRTGDRDSR